MQALRLLKLTFRITVRLQLLNMWHKVFLVQNHHGDLSSKFILSVFSKRGCGPVSAGFVRPDGRVRLLYIYMYIKHICETWISFLGGYPLEKFAFGI